MPLYELADNKMDAIEQTTFAAVKVRERDDLQRLLRSQIEVIVPDGLVLAEEFSNWEDSKRSIDLLVLDRDANLVIVELKRTEDGGHMELQAIRYAAMVSAMRFEQAVEAHRRFLMQQGSKEDAQANILAHLGWEEPDEDAFAQDVRIVLASADFSKELTTAVLWLNERDLDIRCVRMVPYGYEGKTLVDVQQVIPLPEAVEYQVRVKEKASQERAARQQHSDLAEKYYRFWTSLLEKANAALPLHRNVTASRVSWVATISHGIQFSYANSRVCARVDIYLTRPDKAENKAIFDELLQHQTEIEQAVGEPLVWQRMDNKGASRVSLSVNQGSFDDESTWDELQRAMVDAMSRFETALRPYVERYRQGAAPDSINGRA